MKHRPDPEDFIELTAEDETVASVLFAVERYGNHLLTNSMEAPPIYRILAFNLKNEGNRKAVIRLLGGYVE